jgi:hypothetical protein
MEHRDKDGERKRERERERERETRNVASTRRRFALLRSRVDSRTTTPRDRFPHTHTHGTYNTYAYMRTRAPGLSGTIWISHELREASRSRKPARAQREIFTDKKAVFQIPYRFIALIRAHRLTIHLACPRSPPLSLSLSLSLFLSPFPRR